MFNFKELPEAQFNDLYHYCLKKGLCESYGYTGYYSEEGFKLIQKQKDNYLKNYISKYGDIPQLSEEDEEGILAYYVEKLLTK